MAQILVHFDLANSKYGSRADPLHLEIECACRPATLTRVAQLRGLLKD